jgi:predicted aspartyl protease
MIRPMLLALAGTLLCAQNMPASHDIPATSRSSTPVGPASVEPFESFRGMIFIRISLNGHAVDALVDSGADFSLVDSTLAARLGLVGRDAGNVAAAHGALAVKGLPPVTLSIGNAPGITLPILSTDLSAPSRLLGRRVDFILGGDVFRRVALRLDFDHQTMQLSAPGGAAQDGAFVVPLSLARFAPVVPIMIGDRKLNAMLDLGAGGELRLSPEIWAEVRGPSPRVAEGASAGANGEIQIEQKAHIAAVRLGAHMVPNVEVRVSPMPTHLAGMADAIIGERLLARFNMVMDIPSHQLWLTPRAGLAPAPVERTGLALAPSSQGFRVLHVSPGSPAAAAGWKDGETICSVDGVAVDAGRANALDWTLRPDGTIVHIGTCEGHERSLTLKTYY